MGRLPIRGGARPKGARRIQLDFNYAGMRYRPTIAAVPNESNLQRARAKLRRIRARIAAGTFSFNEEFPAYRYQHRPTRSFSNQTCNDVFDAYLVHCEARLAKLDLAYATLASYRRVIDATWRPAIGSRRFDQVNYSMLVKIADAKPVGKKTYNNIVSVLRRAFEHGYRDHPERHNPARGLKTLRMRRRIDRPLIHSQSTMPKRSSPRFIRIGARRRATTTSSGSSRDSALLSRSRCSYPIAIWQRERSRSRRRA